MREGAKDYFSHLCLEQEQMMLNLENECQMSLTQGPKQPQDDTYDGCHIGVTGESSGAANRPGEIAYSKSNYPTQYQAQ